MRLYIFRHLFTKRCLRHYSALMNGGSPCAADLRYYINVESDFVSKLTDNFKVVYGVESCFGNDRDALFSRINFAQRIELRSSFEFVSKIVVYYIKSFLLTFYMQKFLRNKRLLLI